MAWVLRHRPSAASPAERLAVLILHLMRVAVAVSDETDLPDREAVLGDLRTMLHRLLVAD